MVDEWGKKDEEKVRFASDGEAIGYISLDQASALAIHTLAITLMHTGACTRGVTSYER